MTCGPSMGWLAKVLVSILFATKDFDQARDLVMPIFGKVQGGMNPNNLSCSPACHGD